MKILKNNKGGTAIVMTVLILAVILSSSMAVNNVILNGLQMNTIQIHAVKSFFAAEGGAERMLWEIRQDSFDFSGCGSNDEINYNNLGCTNNVTDYTHTFGNGSKFVLYYNYANPDTTITSVGNFLDTARQVKIKY